MGIVEEECDECMYWMELLVRAELIQEGLIRELMKEANEIPSMVVASKKTARRAH
jgi:four helix bundle protein